MKRQSRIFISTLCAGVLLFAGFILVVNLYVQSGTVQRRIRNALSNALEMRVDVFRTTFSPWGGFRLDQIKIASVLPGKQPDFLRAEVLEVRCEFLPLLKGRVVLKRIALESPQLVFQKNAAGQFRLPQKTDGGATPNGPTAPLAILPKTITRPATEAPPGALSSPSPTTPAPLADSEETKPPQTELDIRKLLLRNGTIRLLAEDGSELVRFEGVRCSLNATSISAAFTGELEIKRALIFNRFEASQLEAGVKLQDGILQVEKIVGDMADGHIDGSADADFRSVGRPYHVRLRLGKAQLDKLVANESDFTKRLSGLISFRTDYGGFATDPDKNRGTAELKISHARVSKLPILQIISQVSRASELNELSIRKTEIKAELIGKTALISPSYLQSDHLQVLFGGQIDPQQNLALKAQLVVDDALFKKLPTEARENFEKNRTLNQQALDFEINGTLSSPKTNLINRLIGDKLQKKLKNFLSSFGGEDATPEPSPTE